MSKRPNYINDDERYKTVERKITEAFLYLLARKKINEIYVKDICSIAKINRTSFYNHYQDINDFLIKYELDMSKKVREIFPIHAAIEKTNFVRLFEFIRENRIFYSAYLFENDNNIMAFNDYHFYKENIIKYDGLFDYVPDELDYHIVFFSGGLISLCKKWIKSNFKASCDEMADVLQREYLNRKNN